MILAFGIKIIFWAIYWRLDSLVLSPQLPPLGVVVLFSNSSTENLPTPLVDQLNRTAGTPPSSVPSSLRRLYRILKRHRVKTSMKLSLLLSSHRRRLWAPGGRDLVWSQFARSLCNISSVFACISCKWLAFYRLLVLSERERKQEIDLGDNSPLVRKSKTVLNSGFKVLDFNR